ncbi:diaminopimelate decarboxylase|uniref:Diaminopimelate decarboxylase n=1 Tax=Dendrosporobacter quercicolus TaxID=146817 RepID=A0A1G9SGY9_9FIRM|nr:diaminopimelate decarboxylase [Dendrosporobacter quercicolus]NSL48720.1 diaminopimelate decarboxylase [Dendrosporobacter quercicolus DSM 1736]SDM34699.1 diaminopimelate decarboxylase [Dendrosporobacter quercicolus]
MAKKTLPFTKQQLEEIIRQYPTPFHIYDEAAIRKNARQLLAAFSWAPRFKEYFAIKATPNPVILKFLREEGIGADCSSLPELLLAEMAGITGEDIMFSSNDTPAAEFQAARKMGAIINLDDISHIDYLEKHAGIPEIISFRYNPGPLMKNGNTIIGYPEEAKYGLTKEQILQAYPIMKGKGVKRFGIHTMVISNELNADSFIATADMMFDLIVELKKNLEIDIEFVNFGGGIGIPYKPEQEPVDLAYVGQGIKKSYEEKITANGLQPLRIAMECGRMITGPYGYLVATVLHKKEIYKNYVGLDACMTNLMRPALYGAYHHITVVGKEGLPLDHVYDVTGSLCENNDKFAVDRQLPAIEIGDRVVIHDAGAHGFAMGFNYNGKLRSAELLLKADGGVELIRRAETIADYFATLDVPATGLQAAATKSQNNL